MGLITSFNRWNNYTKFPSINFDVESIKGMQPCTIAASRASLRECHIGKLLLSHSNVPSAGATAFEFEPSGSFLTIADLVVNKAWQKMGVGKRLFCQSFEILKVTFPPNTIVDGWVVDENAIGFWIKFGFEFPKDRKHQYMIARLGELRL